MLAPLLGGGEVVEVVVGSWTEDERSGYKVEHRFEPLIRGENSQWFGGSRWMMAITDCVA